VSYRLCVGAARDDAFIIYVRWAPTNACKIALAAARPVHGDVRW